MGVAANMKGLVKNLVAGVKNVLVNGGFGIYVE